VSIVRVQNTIRRMSRVYPEVLLEQLLKMSCWRLILWRIKPLLRRGQAQLQVVLNNAADPSQRFLVEVIEDTEQHRFVVQVEMVAHGVPHTYRLSYDFFASTEYRRIGQLAVQINDLLEEGAFVKRGERSIACQRL
jgi:DNA gyrase subunit B